MRNFRNYKVWRDAHALTLSIYKITANFPTQEKFGLVNQMRRSAYSVPTNLAEGSARSTEKDFAHFLTISLGSVSELDYQLELSKDLQYINERDYLNLVNQLTIIRKQLIGFHKKLKIN